MYTKSFDYNCFLLYIKFFSFLTFLCLDSHNFRQLVCVCYKTYIKNRLLGSLLYVVYCLLNFNYPIVKQLFHLASVILLTVTPIIDCYLMNLQTRRSVSGCLQSLPSQSGDAERNSSRMPLLPLDRSAAKVGKKGSMARRS